jgi:colicin import membrane protein
MEESNNRLKEREIQKKMESLQSKYILQQQMRDREKQKEESQAEYQRDKRQVDNIVKKLIQEDLNQMEDLRRKKEMLRDTMHNAYEDKELRKQQNKEEEKLQKEKERQYFEEVAKREREHQEKKAAVQEEKNRIFDTLTAEAERKQAEKDYWENVRNDLYIEEQNRKEKIKGLQELEKRQR